MKSLSKVLAIGLWAAAASALSAPPANTDYSHLILLIKDDGSRSHSVQDNVDPSSTFQHRVPNIKPLVPPAKARTLEDAQALHRHRLDRYYIIDTRHLTPAQAQALAAQLKQDPAIEDADFEPLVDGMHDDRAAPVEASPRSGIPDYTERQHYLFGQQAVAPYKIGGVNAVQAWKVPGGKGENMRVISSEIDHWSYDHADLPKPFLEVDAGAETGYHDTASVGTIASRENAFGTTGIVPAAQLGYAQFGSDRLMQTAERLSAGDVVQLGVHYKYTTLPEAGCTADCFMPLEYNKTVRDIITYLTEEKGVHVVLAAANGNIDLDHPYFNGWFDRNRFDSGSIYAGAVEPKTGLRAWFSQYGSRVDLFSWGGSVTTTTWSASNPTSGYTHTYSGTSSANPIIAGVMASLQGVARAHDLGNLPPKELRRILVATGYPQSDGNRTQIGVQPDLDAAIKKMLADGVGQPPTGRLAVPEEARSGETFISHVYAESPKLLTFRWNATGFTPATGDGPTLSLTAPTVPVDTLTSISVDVSDGTHTLGLTENITIKAAPLGDCATPWVANKVYAVAGERVSYSGYNYQVAHWTQNARPDLNFVETGAAKPWRRLGTCGGGSELPVARITGPASVEAGKAVLLSGVSSTGQGLRFAWAANGFNPASSAQSSSSFVAPNTAGTRTITLTVTDERSRTATTSHSVNVTAGAPANRPPTGNVTGNETIESGTTVNFIANTSDPDGDPMTYAWTLPDVLTASIRNTRSISVTARPVSNDTRATISVAVSDGRGGLTRLDKQFTVKPTPESGNCGNIPPWSATKVYSTYAESVSYNGKVYKQNFYNLNKPPDVNSAAYGKEWQLGVPCP
ncbi:S8 family serine peptidase [Pseudomonas sp. MPB23]|uniref:S8 family peptidase n=1 Tax=Pseudomonas sp. MPB23 TaxID=3388490 RepID=UPI003984687D